MAARAGSFPPPASAAGCLVAVPNHDSLRNARNDSAARVTTPGLEIPAAVPSIEGTGMSGGFLDKQCIHFGANLISMIGARKPDTLQPSTRSACVTSHPSETTVIDALMDQAVRYTMPLSRAGARTRQTILLTARFMYAVRLDAEDQPAGPD